MEAFKSKIKNGNREIKTKKYRRYKIKIRFLLFLIQQIKWIKKNTANNQRNITLK